VAECRCAERVCGVEEERLWAEQRIEVEQSGTRADETEVAGGRRGRGGEENTGERAGAVGVPQHRCGGEGGTADEAIHGGRVGWWFPVLGALDATLQRNPVRPGRSEKLQACKSERRYAGVWGVLEAGPKKK